jgi:hypothetical protein
MANAKEINQVVEAFELWRHNRGSRKPPTPQALRKQAVDLLEHCTYSNVTSMLRTSGSQLKQWRESVKPSQTNHDFIQLPARSEAHHIVNKHPKIELRFCNGTALNFSGEITQALLVTMIQEAKS